MDQSSPPTQLQNHTIHGTLKYDTAEAKGDLQRSNQGECT